MATNKNLKEMVGSGKFREDLYFRLNIFQLELEEISKNKENLEHQIHKLFANFKIKYNRPILQLSPNVLGLLMAAPWKGNYRELKNCMEFTVAICDKNTVEREDLPNWFLEENTKSEACGEVDFIAHFPTDFNLALECFESWYLKAMFIKFNGKVNETSRILGISKTTLINKAKKYQIDTLSMRAQANHLKVFKIAA
jgi:DNA-binding NtrC family response regulator